MCMSNSDFFFGGCFSSHFRMHCGEQNCLGLVDSLFLLEQFRQHIILLGESCQSAEV